MKHVLAYYLIHWRLISVHSHKHSYLSFCRWAKTKRAQLEAIGSTIEFQFHKLQFSNYLRNGQAQEALQYARQHFAHFATKEIKGKHLHIQSLSPSLFLPLSSHSFALYSFND
jgi:hypothetical protein